MIFVLLVIILVVAFVNKIKKEMEPHLLERNKEWCWPAVLFMVAMIKKEEIKPSECPTHSGGSVLLPNL